MSNKKIILLIGLLLIVAALTGYFLIEREIKEPSPAENKQVEKVHKSTSTAPKNTAEKEENSLTADLYNNDLYNLSLASIVEISKMPALVKEKIDKILELSQGCYLLKQNSDSGKIYILLQNPVENAGHRYSRHNLQMAVINNDGSVHYKDIGFSGNEGEIENIILKSKTEDWEFDESIEPARPLKHTTYDKKKQVLYSECWNYDDSEPVKYEMKDANDNVVSIMKGSFEGDSTYREEHIFYDHQGNIEKTVVITFEGANIKWFTYYDAAMQKDSVTIEFEYNNGQKTGEKIYNNKYQLTEIIKACYNDDLRTGIKVYDSENNEVLSLKNQP